VTSDPAPPRFSLPELVVLAHLVVNGSDIAYADLITRSRTQSTLAVDALTSMMAQGYVERHNAGAVRDKLSRSTFRATQQAHDDIRPELERFIGCMNAVVQFGKPDDRRLEDPLQRREIKVIVQADVIAVVGALVARDGVATVQQLSVATQLPDDAVISAIEKMRAVDWSASSPQYASDEVTLEPRARTATMVYWHERFIDLARIATDLSVELPSAPETDMSVDDFALLVELGLADRIEPGTVAAHVELADKEALSRLFVRGLVRASRRTDALERPIYRWHSTRDTQAFVFRDSTRVLRALDLGFGRTSESPDVRWRGSSDAAEATFRSAADLPLEAVYVIAMLLSDPMAPKGLVLDVIKQSIAPDITPDQLAAAWHGCQNRLFIGPAGVTDAGRRWFHSVDTLLGPRLDRVRQRLHLRIIHQPPGWAVEPAALLFSQARWLDDRQNVATYTEAVEAVVAAADLPSDFRLLNVDRFVSELEHTGVSDHDAKAFGVVVDWIVNWNPGIAAEPSPGDRVMRHLRLTPNEGLRHRSVPATHIEAVLRSADLGVRLSGQTYDAVVDRIERSDPPELDDDQTKAAKLRTFEIVRDLRRRHSETFVSTHANPGSRDMPRPASSANAPSVTGPGNPSSANNGGAPSPRTAGTSASPAPSPSTSTGAAPETQQPSSQVSATVNPVAPIEPSAPQAPPRNSRTTRVRPDVGAGAAPNTGTAPAPVSGSQSTHGSHVNGDVQADQPADAAPPHGRAGGAAARRRQESRHRMGGVAGQRDSSPVGGWREPVFSDGPDGTPGRPDEPGRSGSVGGVESTDRLPGRPPPPQETIASTSPHQPDGSARPVKPNAPYIPLL
jgi:hypothetical protein